MKKIIFLIIITAISIILTSCTATAPIQSARIKSRVSFGAATSYHHYDHTLQKMANDSTVIGIKNIKHDSELGSLPVVLRPNFKIGFTKRFEASLFFVPLFFIITHVEGNIKFALMDRGKNRLFRNIALAGFAGGSRTGTEWDDYTNAWIGAIIGTYKTYSKGQDLELVFMPTYTVHGKKFTTDCQGDFLLDDKSLDLTMGLIFRALDEHVEFKAGITHRIFFQNKLTIIDEPEHNVYHRLQSSDISPWAFNAGVMFVFGKPRSRKK